MSAAHRGRINGNEPPNGGETLRDDQVVVSWTATDPDGDPLSFNIRVWVSDGLHTSSDQSDATFVVANLPPTLSIQEPADNTRIYTIAAVWLRRYDRRRVWGRTG